MSRHYGQFNVPEAHSALQSLHLYRGGTLHVVDWEPRVGVLDQEDLYQQGIDTSALVPGAPRVDALGDCTANAFTAALSNLVASENQFGVETARLGPSFAVRSFTDVVAAEKFAIGYYHYETDLTGVPHYEWPPVDCGSSGPFVVQAAQKLGFVKGQKIAHGADNLVSLLQTGGVLMGGPFLYAWEEPPAGGIVDGDGTPTGLEAQLALGVAGGHETFISGIAKLKLAETGHVDPEQTLLKVRNSWGPSWGDNGSFYIHLSTLVMLGSYFDFRQLVAQ